MKNSRLMLEIMIVAVVGGLSFFLLSSVDAFEWLVDFSRTHEEWELDEFIIAVWVTLLLGLSLTIYHLYNEIALVKEQARQLRIAKRRADEISRMKSDFLSMVSHEFRTPLTSISGFAKLIQKDLGEISLGPECLGAAAGKLHRIGDNTDVIVSEGERLTQLINNVLDITKIESGRLEWDFRQISMEDVLTQSIDATRVLFIEKGLVLEKSIPFNLPSITGDFDRLVQVCVNLLSNAVKFTPEGQVMCSVLVEDGDIVVRISDTGIGIPEEDEELIFDKFKQLGDTLTNKPKGTGLGLSICREIVEHHNGRIWCERNPDKGTAFVFRLPIASPGPRPLD